MIVPISFSGLELGAMWKSYRKASLQKKLMRNLEKRTIGKMSTLTKSEQFTTDDPSKIGTGAIKYDGGKPSVYRGLIKYFPRALYSIAEVSTFGATKYAWNGWANVEEGFDRYKDGQFRHILMREMGEEEDPDSGLLHLAHEAWNAVATLELYLREKEENNSAIHSS